MFDGNLPRKMRHTVFAEAFQNAAKLDGLVFLKMNGLIESRDKHWTRVIPDFVKHLRGWG